MIVTAIILSYGDFENTTYHALESLKVQLSEAARLNWNFICFDNGSDSATQSSLSYYQRKNPFFSLVLNEKNLGFAGGMNEAATKMDAKWLLLVNSDLRFPIDFLSRSTETLGSCDQSIAVVLPNTNEAGNAQYLYFQEADPLSILCRAEKIFERQSHHLFEVSRADFCCAFVRKSIWDQLGGLSKDYGRGYFEDFDFGERCRAINNKIVLADDLFVYHKGSSSFARDPQQRELIRKNKNIFRAKFPATKIRHKRYEVFDLIAETIAVLPPVEPIKTRVHARFESLMRLMPRSPIKRLIFQIKLLILHRRLRKW